MMNGNMMMVSYSKYLELKATGRVRGGDPQATASEPVVYTDDNGIEWGLSVQEPSTAGLLNMNTPGPSRPRNRHERRAYAALRRKK